MYEYFVGYADPSRDHVLFDPLEGTRLVPDPKMGEDDDMDDDMDDDLAAYMGPAMIEFHAPLTTLDAILRDAAPRVFFMKMHLKGGEFEALYNAQSLFPPGEGPCLIHIELGYEGEEVEGFQHRGYEEVEGWVPEDRASDRRFALFQAKDYDACAARFAA